MAGPEKVIQSKIQIELRKHDGKYWNNPTGDGVPIAAIKALRAKYIDVPSIRHDLERLPRISFGHLGSPDIIGVTPLTITADMVGCTVGVFTGIEVKTETGRQSDDQKKFELGFTREGGVYMVERSHVGIAERIREAIVTRVRGSRP